MGAKASDSRRRGRRKTRCRSHQYLAMGDDVRPPGSIGVGRVAPRGGVLVRRRHGPPNETRPDPAPRRRAPGTTPATPHSSAPPPALAAADDTTPAASAVRPPRSSPDPLPSYETA